MLITCPACDARYEVDAALIYASGRSVRCSNCDAEWTIWPQADAGDAAAAQAPESAPAPVMAAADAPQAPAPGAAEPALRTAPQAEPGDRPETQLARSLSGDGADGAAETRGGGWFLWGFALAAAASLGGAIVYIRSDEIAAAAPQLADALSEYTALVDWLRSELADLAARLQG